MKRSFASWSIFALTLAWAACAGQDMTLSNQGVQALSESNYEQAELYLGEALHMNPENPYALLNMGVLYQKTGRSEQARQMYQKVIELHPGGGADLGNGESSAKNSPAHIASKNLSLLEKEEAQLAAARGKPTPAPSPVPVTQEKIRSTPESPPDKDTAKEDAVIAERQPDRPDKAPATAVEEGHYAVQAGDTLAVIAGRMDVYGDALKWPILFRLNMERLRGIKFTRSFPNEKLPAGINLKYVRPEGAAEALRAVGDKFWIVNVASVQNQSGIIPYVILLMKSGYHPYLTRAEVAGKSWIRLRVGFFPDGLAASKAGKEIKSLLGTSEQPWVIRIGREELEKFGGYGSASPR